MFGPIRFSGAAEAGAPRAAVTARCISRALMRPELAGTHYFDDRFHGKPSCERHGITLPLRMNVQASRTQIGAKALHQAVQRGLLGVEAQMVDGRAIRRPLGLLPDDSHKGFPKW